MSKTVSWPRHEGTVTEHGTWSLTTEGITHHGQAFTTDDARATIIERLAAQAAWYRRPMIAAVTDPEGTYTIHVHPDGTVTDTPRRRLFARKHHANH